LNLALLIRWPTSGYFDTGKGVGPWQSVVKTLDTTKSPLCMAVRTVYRGGGV
jgi:hypothetical protein